jgi:hypothetical protein
MEARPSKVPPPPNPPPELQPPIPDPFPDIPHVHPDPQPHLNIWRKGHPILIPRLPIPCFPSLSAIVRHSILSFLHGLGTYDAALALGSQRMRRVRDVPMLAVSRNYMQR